MTTELHTQKIPDAVRRMLQDRIANNLVLPMQSQTTVQVIALCKKDDVDIHELTDLIQRDPALAGNLMAITNSAAYAGREKITSLHQALNRLGISAISEIAIAVSLKGKVFDVPGYATRIRDLWIHSAVTASFTREVARDVDRRARRERPLDVDSLFLCGLLHAVGKPIVMQNLADMVREKTDKPVPRGLMELAMDRFYEPVGAMLVDHWEFPEWMSTVVRCHRQYERADDFADEARIVGLAADLSEWALAEESTAEDFDAGLPVIGELGLEYDDVSSLLERRGEVLEMADSFL